MKKFFGKVLCIAIAIVSVLLPGNMPVLAADSVDMYRLYNPNSGEHFYTAVKDERNHLIDVGWQYEGIGWVAPSTSNTPVYRLYNANGGEHHYTVDSGERDMLVKAGWSFEGIGWYSDDAKTIPLYREYNPNAFSCNHNYTTDKSEHDYLVSIGWRDEEIGWYGIEYGNPNPPIELNRSYVEVKGYLNNGYFYINDYSEMWLCAIVGSGESVTWTSSDPSIAAVYPYGINAFVDNQHTTGKVTITATASDGSSASCVYNFATNEMLEDEKKQQAIAEAKKYHYSIK